MRKICFLAKDMHFRGTIRRKRTCQFCGYPLQVSRASRNICEETFLSIVSVDRWKVGRVMRIRRVSRCAFPKKCSSEISSMLFKKHECCANGQRSPTPIYIYIHTHTQTQLQFIFIHTSISRLPFKINFLFKFNIYHHSIFCFLHLL
jgi:hypothetical protein